MRYLSNRFPLASNNSQRAAGASWKSGNTTLPFEQHRENLPYLLVGVHSPLNNIAPHLVQMLSPIDPTLHVERAPIPLHAALLSSFSFPWHDNKNMNKNTNEHAQQWTRVFGATGAIKNYVCDMQWCSEYARYRHAMSACMHYGYLRVRCHRCD